VDLVPTKGRDLHIFNIGGNKYRLVAAIHYQHAKIVRASYINASGVRCRKVEKMKLRTAVKPMKNPGSREPFLAIRTEREYDAAVERLNSLVNEVGDNPKDPRYRLIETLSVLIEAYDREHHSLPEASSIEVIRFLMEEHGLTQKDLPEIGSQGVVSEVLAGRRALNIRQIQGLAARFGVDPGAFLTMAGGARLAR
jgi:HTH-type transcriptional regulator/antitoxin HigA